MGWGIRRQPSQVTDREGTYVDHASPGDTWIVTGKSDSVSFDVILGLYIYIYIYISKCEYHLLRTYTFITFYEHQICLNSVLDLGNIVSLLFSH